MKKMFSKFLLLVAGVLLFSGCEDDIVNSELQLDLTKTGAVEVYLFANLNAQELGLQPVPNGVKVLFTVNYSQFNPNATTGRWSHVGEVNNGVVRLESVPSRESGVVLQIIPESFVYEQVQAYNAPSATLKKLFHASPVNVSVYPDQTSFREINYSFSDLGTPALIVSRAWQGTSIFNLISGQQGYIPQGTQLTLFNENWTTTVSVQQNGRFSAEVPYGQSFTLRFTAFMTELNNEGMEVQRLYRYTATAGPYYEDSPAAHPLFFSFQLWE
ncbi:MAG: hypothetical protein EA361_11605 [Bacteroidetes bacterium]|nr:MAG: hypothetical protein EA361_11605 [Bacteroidota bacterium]